MTDDEKVALVAQLANAKMAVNQQLRPDAAVTDAIALVDEAVKQITEKGKLAGQQHLAALKARPRE